jgi:bisphosphoglycerate-dependent phosphoglycerate mutase
MINIIYCRHGFSNGNLEQKLYGISSEKDLGLVEKGKMDSLKNAKKIRKFLDERGISVDIVASSRMKRAVETAQIIAPYILKTKRYQINIFPYIASSRAMDVLSSENINNIKFYQSNYEKFLSWIRNNIELFDNFTLFVVTHDNFMRKLINTKIKNNDCILIRYNEKLDLISKEILHV